MPLDSLDTIPFEEICDDEFTFMQSDYECCEQVFDQFDQLNLCSFQNSDYRAHDQEGNIDPYINYFIMISPQIVNIILNINLTKISICHIVFLVLTHAVSMQISKIFENRLILFSTSLLFLKYGLNPIRLPSFN